MNVNSKLLSLILLLLALVPLQAQETARKKNPKKANPQHDFAYRFDDDLKQTPDSIARLEKWFFDAKFGAFIHFGAYSSLEGEYEGRGSQHRYSEWIQVSGKITADEYHEVAAKFNPADFDADALSLIHI